MPQQKSKRKCKNERVLEWTQGTLFWYRVKKMLLIGIVLKSEQREYGPIAKGADHDPTLLGIVTIPAELMLFTSNIRVNGPPIFAHRRGVPKRAYKITAAMKADPELRAIMNHIEAFQLVLSILSPPMK